MRVAEVNGHLASRVNGVKDELIVRLQSSGAELGAMVRTFPLHCKTMHQIGIVDVSSSRTLIRCLVKGNVPNYQGAQKLENEHHILTRIAPNISALNKKIQCPRVLAFFPREELLFLELIEGRALKSILFDLAPSRPDLSGLLRLTGEWLGRLHLSTQDGEGNPFDWLEEQFDTARIRGTFENCAVRQLYRATRDLLQQFRRTYQNFRRPLCQIHGEFTPLHVLVKNDSIYVIDFGSSGRGFACEDVALFTTFYDSLQPWRSATGLFRVPFHQQKDSFLTSYRKHCGQDFGRIDDVIAMFTRIWAMARLEFFWERQPASWPETIYLGFGRAWMRRRFVSLASRELRSLQTLASRSNLPSTGAARAENRAIRPPSWPDN